MYGWPGWAASSWRTCRDVRRSGPPGWRSSFCAFGLGVFATAGALATMYLLRRCMIAHLGGCTGDTLGATVEVVEAVILVTATSGL